MEPNAQGQPPVDWWRLSQAQRNAHIASLWDFTRQLVRSYRFPTPIVPPCWFRHDELIQELLALKGYREEQFANPSPSAAFDFHGQLQLWITRMRSWVLETGCTGNQHVPKPSAMWVVPGSLAACAAEKALDELLGTPVAAGANL